MTILRGVGKGQASAYNRTMKITLIDDSIHFDALMPTTRPLGGAEKAFAALPGALVRAGHRVTAINHAHADMTIEGAKWRTWDSRRDHRADVLIAYRKPTLLGALRGARRRLLWVTAHPRYLETPATSALLRSFEARLLFVSQAQRALYQGPQPAFVLEPGARFDYLREAEMTPESPPRAVVTTHPLHGLDWLIGLWRTRIRPACPGAELHVYSATLLRALAGEAVAAEMRPIADMVMDARGDGVFARKPDGDMYMADDYLKARVHLYPGQAEDWGCWTLAETQAMGLPAVVRPLGAAAERLVEGKTGFVAKNDDDFVRQTLQILNQDEVFKSLSAAARTYGRARTWDAAALSLTAWLENER